MKEFNDFRLITSNDETEKMFLNIYNVFKKGINHL